MPSSDGLLGSGLVGTPAAGPQDLFQLFLSNAETTQLNGGTITQESDGIEITVPAGAASPNPPDHVAAVFLAQDFFGQQVNCATQWFNGGLNGWVEVTAPANTSDTLFGIGFYDRSTLGTAIGCYHAVIYSGGTRTLRVAAVNAGVATATDGGADNDARIYYGPRTQGRLAVGGTCFTSSYDASNVFQGTTNRFWANTLSSSSARIVIFGARSALTAAPVVGRFRFFDRKLVASNNVS